MSRIGKLPVKIISGVKVNLDGNKIKVSGPKGELTKSIHPYINVKIDGENVVVSRNDDKKFSKSLHGLTRSVINGMVKGVSEGFKKELLLVGVGYKAELKGDSITFTLGYSHQIDVKLPKGIKAQITDKNLRVILESCDKELIGRIASEMRALKVPEPYKGKGVRYSNEIIKKKVGKAGAQGAA